MGTSSSTSQNGEVTVGRHSPLPQDVQPYQGSFLECLVISIPLKFRSKYNAVASDIDDHYPAISRYLEQRYTLNTFCPLPKSFRPAGFNKVEVLYEAIFSKPVGLTTSQQNGADLLIERSTVHYENSRRARVADSSDIMNKITRRSSEGGRLINLEINGHGVTRGINFQMTRGMGVDILFEIPREATTPKYAYQVINVPFTVIATMRHQASHCDWLGPFLYHLSQGWKLVRVFIDGSRERNGREFTVNSTWIFEKEASKVEDSTPLYEGIIIEYYHKVTSRGSVKTDWGPIIVEMGRRGWELACVQESGEMHVSGLGTVEMKLNMFFQRRIVVARGVPPPTYSSRPSSRDTTLHLPHQRQLYPPSEAPSYPPSYRSERF